MPDGRGGQEACAVAERLPPVSSAATFLSPDPASTFNTITGNVNEHWGRLRKKAGMAGPSKHILVTKLSVQQVHYIQYTSVCRPVPSRFQPPTRCFLKAASTSTAEYSRPTPLSA
jgi:hypothetical protein